MITLLSDIRVLTINSKYSYLNDNYASGVSTLQISNTDGFAVNYFILVGEEGKETTEMFRIGSVNTTTGDITLLTASGTSATTRFSHSESTQVTIIPYDQIRFYWTAALGTIADETPTFDTVTPLTGWVAISPADLYSTYSDESHSTGFGWFVYKNSVSLVSSQTSNPIPYVGFSLNTVSTVFSDFDSLLNVKELNLVTLQDKFSWINEALSMVKNKLNLTNTEYTVSAQKTISIVSGTAEYQLPDDFSDLIEITNGVNTSSTSGDAIAYIPVSQILSNKESTLKYYMRGRYIGFSPTPSTAATFYYRYRSKSSRLTSLSDYIDLPDNGYYSLKEFMMYRAQLKFKDPSTAVMYLKAFTDSLNLSIQSSVKRDANLDTWAIERSANV